MNRTLGLVALGTLVLLSFVRVASADPVHDGLVSWWKMDEPSWSGTAGEVVDSQSENHCTAVAEATTATGGYIARSGTFDQTAGGLDYVSCGTGIQVASAYTYEAWAYVEPGERFGFWQRGGGTWALADFQIEFYVPDDTAQHPIVVHNRTYGMNWRQFDAHSIPTEEWVHVVLTWEDLDWKLYVNGQVVGVYTTFGTPADPPTGEETHLGLGARQYGATGKLDEVRIYDRALTLEEVQHNYDYERGLLAWWKMDEPSWSGTADEVIDSHGVSHCTAVGDATTDADGYIDRSGVFDRNVGAVDYVSCGGDIQVSSAYTFEAWAYLEPGERFGFWQRGGGTWALANFQIEFYVPDNVARRPTVVHDRTYGMNYRQFEDHSIPTGEWAHVVLTWNGPNYGWELYVNGQEVAAVATVGTPADPPVGEMTHLGIGERQHSAVGKLDEVRIYDRALTRREIWERYEVSDIATRPHVARVGTNLMPNASAEDPDDWFFGGSAGRVSDPTVARTGSWAVKLPGSDPNPVAKSPATPVTPGTLYTTSFYLQSTEWPPPIVKLAILQYTDPTCYYASYVSQQWLFREAPADGDLWNEVVGFYTPNDDPNYPVIRCVRMKVVRLDEPVGYPVGDVWLDDFYIGEQVGFEQDAGKKRSFASARVRVDALGNMEILRGTIWQPFFPRVIYPSTGAHDEDPEFDWQRYAAQGFNAVNQANTVERAEKARDATDPSFAPDGLMVSFSLDAYLNSSHPLFGCTDPVVCPSPPSPYLTLQEAIDALDTADMLDRVIIYNWDNEKSFEEWDNATNVVSSLRSFDASALVYALNLHPALARMYNNGYHANIQDVTGSYVWADAVNVGGLRDGLPERLFLQDRLEEQKSPALMTQLNNLHDSTANPPGDLRTRIYKGLILGSRGFTVYADCRPADCTLVPKADETLWWDEVPNIRNEIEALIPLIREPHWSKWTLTVGASPDTVVWGTRYHHGYGYIILANMDLDVSSGDVTVTLSGADPGYAPTLLVDYFTGGLVATAVGDTFTVTLSPTETAVYKFVP